MFYFIFVFEGGLIDLVNEVQMVFYVVMYVMVNFGCIYLLLSVVVLLKLFMLEFGLIVVMLFDYDVSVWVDVKVVVNQDVIVWLIFYVGVFIVGDQFKVQFVFVSDV